MPTSKVTVKFQTTIPREVRRALGVEVNGFLRWTLEGGAAKVVPASSNLLDCRGTVKVGRGSPVADVRAARRERGRGD